MTDDERQQVRQQTIEEMLKVAIDTCPWCKAGYALLAKNSSYRTDSRREHFNGSNQWPCHSYNVVEALREAALIP